MSIEARIRVLVADDEPLARAKLSHMLQAEADLELVGECHDGAEVVRSVASLAPDLVLLDIQMPTMTGLEVVRTIGVERMPRTIFVTAYGDFAVEAFDVHAIDYLLKPFDEDRFRRAIGRARAALQVGQRREYEGDLRALLAEFRSPDAYARRFLVKGQTEYLFVRAGDLLWVEADDNYVTLHTAGRSYLVRDTLRSVQERLDPQQFLRVRASAIVNLERVVSIRPWSSTEFQFVLQDGTKVLSSRRYRDRIRTVIP